MQNPFFTAQKQICDAYEIAQFWEKYQKELVKILQPKKIIEINLPIEMDDGSIRVFTAYRSQHNDARGVFKWGIRFHQDVNLDEVKALSLWMTIKTSVVDLPLWGGKWGVIVNPKELSENELEKLSRAYVQAIFKDIGPLVDVPAPDVNTNPAIMGWMVDEYSRLSGVYTPGSFTGKPVGSGGSLGRGKATAQGWLYVLKKFLSLEDDVLENKKIIIEGAGNAGLTFAKLAENEGAKIVGISDSRGAIYNENGISIDEIVALKKNKKSVTNYEDAQKVDNNEILIKNADILVPAALENRITHENASQIQAKIILELANGPTTPDADKILQEKNIVLIPDVLANAGGVMVSYFEQVQNNAQFYWSEEEVEEKLKTKMEKALLDVYYEAKNLNATLRWGAYVIALRRVFETMKVRNYV